MCWSNGSRSRGGVVTRLGIYRLVPAATLFFTFYVLFYALTPARYRKHGCRKWPGALLITAWWLATVEILPIVLGLFGGYSLTYGSLAGVMITLIFFFVVGLGVVIGAELNAALAESGATALKGEVYTGPYTDELEVEEPQPGEDVVVGAGNRGTAALTGLMQGKRGLIMGLANDRSLAWGIARAVARAGRRACVLLSGRGAGKARPAAGGGAWVRPAGRLRRQRHEGARRRRSTRSRSAGASSTSSSTRSAIPTRMSCAGSSSTRRWTIS